MRLRAGAGVHVRAVREQPLGELVVAAVDRGHENRNVGRDRRIHRHDRLQIADACEVHRCGRHSARDHVRDERRAFRAEAQSHQTPLHSAAWNGDLRMVEILIDAGADPHLLDEEHRATPLGWAETALAVTNNARCAEVAEYLRRYA